MLENFEYIYTWEKFAKDLQEIYFSPFLKLNKFNSIAGLACGGLPLAVFLKNKLKLPLRIIFATSYKGKKQKRLKIKIGDLDKLIPPVLVVDDLVDTGNTLQKVVKYLDFRGIKHSTLTLFYKPHSVILPDYFLNFVNDSVWVKFCWE